MLTNVAVFGDEPEEIARLRINPKNVVDDTLVILQRQYANKIQFFITGEPGFSQLVCEKAIEYNIKYGVFLPCLIDEQYKASWSEEQKKAHEKITNIAQFLNIDNTKLNSESLYKRYTKMIDQAQWVLVFWNGRKYGAVYDAIKYATVNNKIIIDALDNLRMVIL